MLQKTVTRGKTKICGKILKQIIAEESTLKATIPENESHIYRKYVIIGTLNFKKCRPSGGTFYFFCLVRNSSGNSSGVSASERNPCKPLHQNPETGFIPLQNFNRSPPAVAERKHTARIGIKFEFQLECSFSPLIRTLKKLWRALGILQSEYCT